MSRCSKFTAGRPCPSCPWRTGNTADMIPGYDHEKAENLAATSPSVDGTGPDFGAPIFACHQSSDGQEFACAGWLATVGHRHPSVRLAVMAGRVHPSQLEPGPGWPELHTSFADVIANLRATQP